jgi:membrane protease YdiL (CAAX protease family)
MLTPANFLAAFFLLAPLAGAGFWAERVIVRVRRLPLWAQLLAPALLSVPYVLVAWPGGSLRIGWVALYALLPVGIACLLWQARRADTVQRGTLIDLLILATLGLGVDLRWFEAAWPAHLAVFGKMLLLDAGVYGFLVMRQLDGVGFDLRLRFADLKIGVHELLMYTPIALALGLSLGFLHLHLRWPGAAAILEAWGFTFCFIALPEELFFRGWLQNLLERRLGRYPALALTAVLFGLSHFNKRAASFNWRYVLLAAVAGVFYGRAWRQQRRIGASAITHASVDAIWSLWLR